MLLPWQRKGRKKKGKLIIIISSLSLSISFLGFLKNILPSHLCYLSWRNSPPPYLIWSRSSSTLQQRERSSRAPNRIQDCLLFSSYSFVLPLLLFLLHVFPSTSFFKNKITFPFESRPPVSSALCDRLSVESQKKKKKKEEESIAWLFRRRNPLFRSLPEKRRRKM